MSLAIKQAIDQAVLAARVRTWAAGSRLAQVEGAAEAMASLANRHSNAASRYLDVYLRTRPDGEF